MAVNPLGYAAGNVSGDAEVVWETCTAAGQDFQVYAARNQ
jgi:hypothetical protein